MPHASAADLQHLKLIAFDADDLKVLSAHLQDAVVRAGDLAYLPDERRFALLARRFDWESEGSEPRRRLTGLHFERVLHCRTRGINRADPDAALNLLAVVFEAPEGPSGVATLVFAGGSAVELELECLEVRMKDLGPVWACTGRPVHDIERT